MSDAIICDQCSKTETRTSGPLFGWREVTRIGVEQVTGEPLHLHFCSWECVLTFAEVMTGRYDHLRPLGTQTRT